MAPNGVGNARSRQKRSVRSTAKKKTHTDKNVILTNLDSQKVVCLSPTYPGKTHDKKVADEAHIHYPAHTRLGKDTGFQGYEPWGVLTWQPTRKPRGDTLSLEVKVINKTLSAARIAVEHVLSGVKRCQIVKAGFSDSVMEIACALHNLRVHLRHPVPTLHLLQLAFCSG